MDESEAQMTDAQAVERGILQAVGKLVLVMLLLGILALAIRSAYVNSEAYQDRKAQEKLIQDLGGAR